MKRNLAFIIFGVLLLASATGCDRRNRDLPDNSTPESQSSAPAPTEALVQPTLAPTDVPNTDVPTIAPSAIPLEPTATFTAAPSVSESDQIANQLDDMLKQFDQQLGSVDSLEDTPAVP